MLPVIDKTQKMMYNIDSIKEDYLTMETSINNRVFFYAKCIPEEILAQMKNFTKNGEIVFCKNEEEMTYSFEAKNGYKVKISQPSNTVSDKPWTFNYKHIDGAPESHFLADSGAVYSLDESDLLMLLEKFTANLASDKVFF